MATAIHRATSTTHSTPPRLVITSGEPAGIGPDISLMLAHYPTPAQLVVMGDPELLAERARQLKLDITLQTFHPDDRTPAAQGSILVSPMTLEAKCLPGVLNPDNSRYILSMLSEAVRGCQSGLFDGMVTAPVNKEVINNAGITFSGHTEFLAEQTNTPKVVMMLATEGLRVALVTTHLPVKAVADAITRASLAEVIHVLHKDLQEKFSIPDPRILVCGLNPHAGEGGHIGTEEIETIIPTLNALRAEGLHLEGPLPADTLFNPKYLEQADAVLAMYHDQGLPVLKFKGFGQSVNITLGLPVIRTSVDHGTALDLAGTGQADAGSLMTAIDYALNMIVPQ